MILTIEELQQYTQDYNDYELNTLIIEAAEDIVSDYLGYDLTSQILIETVDVVSNDYVILSAWIETVNTITLDGVAITDYKIVKNTIQFNRYISGTVVVNYNGGFSVVPSLIKLAMLQIATLKLLETGKKIGVTGVTNPDGVGNTFINYTNYDKYLKPLSKYRNI